MKLCISASDSTIGSMLSQKDENGVERAIYYLSRVLNDAETRYSPIVVYVYSYFDVIKHMLSNPILHSRVGKWALALSKYSLTYQPLKSVKVQIVANFIVNHSMIEATQSYVENKPWTLYFDGSSHKNGTCVGIFIISPLNIPTKFKYKINSTCSNNEAEYKALIVGLEILLGLGAKNNVIKGDSELVVKQLTKEYKCISENLSSYSVSAYSLLNNFESINNQHVPIIENQVANNLA